MSLAQELMLRITGYTDKCSVRPGDEVSFHIHSELNESYDVQMVRLIHGDTNPEGPGFKERLLRSPTNGKYRGQHQPMYAGSYLLVPHDDRLNLQSFTLCAYIFPTTPVTDLEGTPVGAQAIISKFNAKTGLGYGLFINEAGELALRIGRGRGKLDEYSTKKPLFQGLVQGLGLVRCGHRRSPHRPDAVRDHHQRRPRHEHAASDGRYRRGRAPSRHAGRAARDR